MKPKLNSSLARRLSMLAAGAVMLLPFGVRAALVGPYTADANTLHLWHLNEAATPCIDAVAAGATNLVGLLNGATLGNASFSGFGTALNTVDGGQAGGATASARDALLTASTAATPGNVVITLADTTSGAFTFEAVIWIGFDVTTNLGTTANGGNNRNTPLNLISGESGTTANRIFQFRIAPVGFVPYSGAAPTTVPLLTFENIRMGSSGQASIFAQIPTAGPDAIVSNGWYHVAVTYNGVPNTADNIKFYWTAMDPARSAATRLTIVSPTTMLSGLNPLATVTTPFMLGNDGRNRNSNFIGFIDEVRISKIERSAEGMMFASAEVHIDTDPASQIVAAGDNITLVSAASGVGPIGYQWQFLSANSWTNIAPDANPTATGSTLLITNIGVAQSGSYRVVATNSASSRTSLVATVSVGLQVAETFATGLSDGGTPLSGGSVDPHWQLVQSDDPAYPGPALYVDSAPPTAWLANSTNSQWLSPGDGANNIGGTYTYRTTFLLDSTDPAFVQLNGKYITDNQVLDIRLNGVSTGLTNSGALGSFSVFTLTNGFVQGGNTLDFVVTNLPGSGPNPTGIRAELRGAALPLASQTPQVLVFPANVTTQAQQNASFSAIISGSPALTYQWYHDGARLEGKTDRRLVLSSLVAADQGTYTLYATNSLGWTNAAATLTVITPPLLAWVGQDPLAPATWDSTSLNWLDTGSSQLGPFVNLDDVLFDSRGSLAPFVNLAAPLSPNSITVDSSTDYTLYSPAANGWLAGWFPLHKKNTGTLVLDVTNFSAGPITVSGGTLQVGNYDFAPGLGGGSISLSNNTALSFARADTWSVRNVISGGGAVTNLAGTTILTGSNSYAGATVVAVGTLIARNRAALGTADGGTIVANGGQLLIDANIDIDGEAFTLSGAGPGDGALRKGGAGVTTLGGPVTLAADATIKLDGNSTLNLSNAASITGTGFNLTLAADSGSQGTVAGKLAVGAGAVTKSGAGSWTMAGANASLSSLVIGAGRLTLAGATTLGSATNVTISSGGTLALSDGAVGPGVSIGMSCDTAAAARASIVAPSGTNTCAGPISITGIGAGNNGTASFSTDATNAVLIISSAVGGADYTGSMLLRGSGSGFLSGRVNLPNGSVNKTDGGTWVVTSTGNVWTNSTVASGTLSLGANQALPAGVVLKMGQSGSTGILDLGGFNLQIGGITDGGGTEIIANGSTNADSLLTLSSPATWTYNGVIRDSITNTGHKVALTLTGGGSLTLSNVCAYSGDTTLSAGTLALGGAGAIANSATINIAAGATLDARARTNGTLLLGQNQTLKGDGAFTVLGNLACQGTVQLKLNKSVGGLTNDSVNGPTQVAYGGTLKLDLTGSALGTSDTFKLFSAGAQSGAFATIVPATPGSGLAWDTSTLATDGVLRVAPGVPLNPTNITAAVVSGGTVLQLTWPADHTGWTLQAQTNTLAVGLVTNAAGWFPVPNSSTTNQVFIPINTANGSVFYRLIYTAP